MQDLIHERDKLIEEKNIISKNSFLGLFNNLIGYVTSVWITGMITLMTKWAEILSCPTKTAGVNFVYKAISHIPFCGSVIEPPRTKTEGQWLISNEIMQCLNTTIGEISTLGLFLTTIALGIYWIGRIVYFIGKHCTSSEKQKILEISKKIEDISIQMQMLPKNGVVDATAVMLEIDALREKQKEEVKKSLAEISKIPSLPSLPNSPELITRQKPELILARRNYSGSVRSSSRIRTMNEIKEEALRN